jgi:hypothetical protein
MSRRDEQYYINRAGRIIVGLWGNRIFPAIANSFQSTVWEIQVTEPDLGRTQERRSSRQWVKYAITLFLLAAVVVTGALSFHSRTEWWQKYLNYIAGT